MIHVCQDAKASWIVRVKNKSPLDAQKVVEPDHLRLPNHRIVVTFFSHADMAEFEPQDTLPLG